MSEVNKAIAKRVYEIISTGEFNRAEEMVDPDAPDNELLPGDPPAKLMDTFKETFSEARDAFPDMRIELWRGGSLEAFSASLREETNLRAIA